MKKRLLLTVLACVSTLSFAEDECIRIADAKEQESCYNVQINVMTDALVTYYEKIEKSGVLDAEQVDKIHKGHLKWVEYVNATCRSSICINSEVERRLERIYRFYKTEVIPRMQSVEKKTTRM